MDSELAACSTNTLVPIQDAVQVPTWPRLVGPTLLQSETAPQLCLVFHALNVFVVKSPGQAFVDCPSNWASLMFSHSSICLWVLGSATTEVRCGFLPIIPGGTKCRCLVTDDVSLHHVVKVVSVG